MCKCMYCGKTEKSDDVFVTEVQCLECMKLIWAGAWSRDL